MKIIKTPFGYYCTSPNGHYGRTNGKSIYEAQILCDPHAENMRSLLSAYLDDVQAIDINQSSTSPCAVCAQEKTKPHAQTIIKTLVNTAQGHRTSKPNTGDTPMSYIIIADVDTTNGANSGHVDDVQARILKQHNGHVSFDINSSFDTQKQDTLNLCQSLINSGFIQFSIRHSY